MSLSASAALPLPQLTSPIQVALVPRPSRISLRPLLLPSLPRLSELMLLPLPRPLLAVSPLLLPPPRPLPGELPPAVLDLSPTTRRAR
jgi:hypothetical protein